MSLHWLKQRCSRIFQDQLEVFLQPHRIELLRTTRTLRSHFKTHVVRQQIIELPQAAEQDTVDTLMKMLAKTLNHANWHNTVVTVILSNHFVRYTAVPWHAGLRNAAERQAYLAYCFQQAFGDSAKQWNLRMSTAGYGKTNLASAVPHSVIQFLQAACQQAGLTLAAIHPHLMRTLNQSFAQVKRMAAAQRTCLYQSQTKNYTCWFVAIQHDRLCLALIENGHWRLIKNIAAENDISEQVAAQLQRETINQQMTTKPAVLLYWPGLNHGQSLNLEEYTVVKILQNPCAHAPLKSATTVLEWEAA